MIFLGMLIALFIAYVIVEIWAGVITYKEHDDGKP